MYWNVDWAELVEFYRVFLYLHAQFCLCLCASIFAFNICRLVCNASFICIYRSKKNRNVSLLFFVWNARINFKWWCVCVLNFFCSFAYLEMVCVRVCCCCCWSRYFAHSFSISTVSSYVCHKTTKNKDSYVSKLVLIFSTSLTFLFHSSRIEFLFLNLTEFSLGCFSMNKCQWILFFWF